MRTHAQVNRWLTYYKISVMDIKDLSPSAQDYLKVIWDLQEWDHGPVQSTAVAERTGMKPSTVSGALSRLVIAGLVIHEPYGKVSLTPIGRKSAVAMVRRHRLLETFLVRVLEYGWEEVHEEADALEHTVSDLMVDRIDDYLGHPTHDPHGDAIPTREGDLPDTPPTKPLSRMATGTRVRIQRVSDEDSDMLRFLRCHGIGLNTVLTVAERGPDPDSVILITAPAVMVKASAPFRGRSRLMLDSLQASRIRVSPI